MKTYTSPEDEEFFAAIGRLTLTWGHLEFAIDCMVHVLHSRPDAKQIEPEMPRSLQRKISFLRATISQLPLDKQTAQKWLRLLDNIQSAAQKRHDIIHGFVIEQKERSGEAQFVRLFRKGKITKSRRHTANTQSILKAANQASKLASTLFRWVDAALDLFYEPPQQRDGQKPS